MNTRQLECFVQVAANLSFRRAAEELHLSQPTVSKQVASLEGELGGTLFARTTRQVSLTPLGKQFLRDAQEILRLTYAAEGRARRREGGSDLAIGYSDSNELMRLGPVLDGLRRLHDGLHVHLSRGPRDANITQLEHEHLDVVMGFETPSVARGGIGFAPLRSDGLSCVVRNDSPLAGLAELGHEDVRALPQVLCLPPGLRRRGYAAQGDMPDAGPAQTTECSTSSEAYCLVDSGFGYALVPSVYTMPDPSHTVIPWRGHATATYGVYHRVGGRGGMVPGFLEMARKVYAAPAYDRPQGLGWRPPWAASPPADAAIGRDGARPVGPEPAAGLGR